MRYPACPPCVLAMILEVSTEYVHYWFPSMGRAPTALIDAFIFSAHHGVYLAKNIDLVEDDGVGKSISKEVLFTDTYILKERIKR